MNSSALAKHYDKLTPEERCALSLAAWTRDDEVEFGRLVRAAPRMSCSFGSDQPQVVAFHQITCMHLLEVLDLAAQLYQRLLWKATNGDREDTHVICVAVQFRAQLDGWRQFCAEMGIDPDAVWRKLQLPGLAMVALADMATARANSEARLPAAMVTLLVEESDEPLTADFVARKLRADWRTLAALWEDGR
jgi:hypothetical protein